MSLDITVLRLLRQRARFEKYAKSVPPQALEARVKVLLSDFGAYFDEFHDREAIEPGPFMLWFAFRHPKLKAEDIEVYRGIITQAVQPFDPSLEAGLMERLIMADAAARSTALLERYTHGDELDLFEELRSIVDDTQLQLSRKVRTPQVLTPIEDILAGEESERGLRWRMGVLNKHIKPIRPGDFVIVAARPDKGKTTFCAGETTCMASQIDELWPDEKRCVIWFNNEGPGDNIVSRCFQAALNATLEELSALVKQPAENPAFRTLLHQRYAEELGGRAGALRIFDIHGMTNVEVERIVEKYRPALVLFDMIDNIKFVGGLRNNGERTDQMLEAMYQWARELGVKHDTGVIATSQISAEGDGLQYPTLPMLKDSKTGKQGAADVIVTIGAVNDPTLENSRYIGTTKNKRQRRGVAASPMAEVQIDKHRGRFKEFT